VIEFVQQKKILTHVQTQAIAAESLATLCH
jgi:hypothetical protein